LAAAVDHRPRGEASTPGKNDYLPRGSAKSIADRALTSFALSVCIRLPPQLRARSGSRWSPHTPNSLNLHRSRTACLQERLWPTRAILDTASTRRLPTTARRPIRRRTGSHIRITQVSRRPCPHENLFRRKSLLQRMGPRKQTQRLLSCLRMCQSRQAIQWLIWGGVIRESTPFLRCSPVVSAARVSA
jgi:hypothetical protein